jgi:hypothetical protein
VGRAKLTWWQLLLIAAGCFLLAVIVGPVADRHGRGTFAGLIAALILLATSSACSVIGVIRLGKAIWAWATRGGNLGTD